MAKYTVAFIALMMVMMMVIQQSSALDADVVAVPDEIPIDKPEKPVKPIPEQKSHPVRLGSVSMTGGAVVM